jgi:hypothetical protein
MRTESAGVIQQNTGVFRIGCQVTIDPLLLLGGNFQREKVDCLALALFPD